jgi:glutathione S-transferase
MEQGYTALSVMDRHLRDHAYFAAGHFTIADIALYAYTHLAHECEYDLGAFAAVRAWLARIEAEPGHVSMDWEPAPETQAAE